MKLNIQKVLRAVPCFLAVVLVLAACVIPASAVYVNNFYTLNTTLSEPTWSSFNFGFVSGDVSFSRISYESYNEAYMVPVIKYDNKVAIYWRDGKSYFMQPEYQFLDFGAFGVDLQSAFYLWLAANARFGYITQDDDKAGQIKDNVDNAADSLEDANNIWDSLPEPTLSGDEFDFLILDRIEWNHLSQFLQLTWQSSTVYEMTLVLGGLLLASFLIFAGK